GFLSSTTHTRTATTSSSSPATTTDPDPDLEKLIANLCSTLESGLALNPLGHNLWPGVGMPRPATSQDQSSDGEADADAPRKW
ncbi:hypothetical protein MKX03_031780, partial [Papaver bracteatum]